MNLLLLSPDEVVGPLVTLNDHRAEHCRRTLGVRPGTRLRAAIIDQGPVHATVVAVDAEKLTLEIGPAKKVNPPSLRVALAIPRPKALSRIVQCISSFGAKEIILFRSWKVERSYLKSPRLDPVRLAEDAQLGCEQGRQCYLPRIRVVSRFTDFTAGLTPDPLDCERAHPESKWVLHPGAELVLGQDTDLLQLGDEAERGQLLVFGPDGGFIDEELERLVQVGCQAVRLNVGPLRTEVAVAAVLGIVTSLRNYTPTHLL